MGIPASSYESFRPRLAEDVWNLIQAARTQLEEQHVAVHGKVVQQAGTLLHARKQLEELNNKATQNAAIREQLQNLQTQLTKLEATINQQKEELIFIEVTEANYINEIEKKLEDCDLAFRKSIPRGGDFGRSVSASARTYRVTGRKYPSFRVFDTETS